MSGETPEKLVGTDQLPDDPLEMPPPYWRSAGAVFHIELALSELLDQLRELPAVDTATDDRLTDHYIEYDDSESDEALEKFRGICGPLWELEHKIKLKAEVASLMSAIEAEDSLNRFCVFNLHKDIAESIEKLAPPEKLLVAAAALGRRGTKQDTAFESARKLSTWRNAFVHGHCSDRPTKSLRHNHLIHPDEFPGMSFVIATMRELVGAYIRLSDYLRAISVNPYTSGGSSNLEYIRDTLAEIAKIRFEGGNYVYSILLSESDLKQVEAQMQAIAQSADPDRTSAIEDLLATLDSYSSYLIALELGVQDGRRWTAEEIMAELQLDRTEYVKARAIALSRLGFVRADLLRPAV